MNLFKFSISDAITGTTITDVCVTHEAYIGDTFCDDALNIVCTQLLNSIHIVGLKLGVHLSMGQVGFWLGSMYYLFLAKISFYQ